MIVFVGVVRSRGVSFGGGVLLWVWLWREAREEMSKVGISWVPGERSLVVVKVTWPVERENAPTRLGQLSLWG